MTPIYIIQHCPDLTFDLDPMEKGVISQKMLLLPQITCNDHATYACQSTLVRAQKLYTDFEVKGHLIRGRFWYQTENQKNWLYPCNISDSDQTWS